VFGNGVQQVVDMRDTALDSIDFLAQPARLTVAGAVNPAWPGLFNTSPIIATLSPKL
jgi:hypothetical protein